jgi:hypothetical protein
MHHGALNLMHCTICLLAHVCSYALDHVVLEFEEPTEQAQFEEFTNLEIGSRQAPVHHTQILDFYFLINIFMLRMIVH